MPGYTPISVYDDYSRRLYHSPFFDLSNFYLPQNFKEFFRWARYFFMTNNIISPTVYQMARYPVTSLMYNTKDDDARRLYKTILEDYLSIQSNLISIGLDFFTYGNAFISLHIPFKRVFICRKCKAKFDADDVDYKFRLGGVKFSGKCPKCKTMGDFIAKDETIKIPKRFKIVKYYPGNIDIKYNSLTGEVQYLYTVPNKDRQAIMRGDKFHINSTSLLYLKAIDERKQIIFKKDRLFHFKRDNISGSHMEWGMPLVLPALKKAFYLQILQKAQEAIAIQHIIPLTMIYPQAGNGMNPYEHVNLRNWKDRIEKVVKLWKKDPNHIGIFPFPVGIQHLFGEGKRLLVTPEVREASIQVVAAMGVPQEFIFGGLSWSASSINLRMLENAFMTYRILIKKFLMFLVDQISTCLSVKKIGIDMKEFKMIDDVQQKEFLLRLNEAKKISDTTLLNSIGRDQYEELEMLEKEWKKKFEIQKKQMASQEKFNSELIMLKNKLAIEAQAEAEKAMQSKQVSYPPIQLQQSAQVVDQVSSYPAEMRSDVLQQINSQGQNTLAAMNAQQLAAQQEANQQQIEAINQANIQQALKTQSSRKNITQGGMQGSRPAVSGGSGNIPKPKEERPM